MYLSIPAGEQNSKNVNSARTKINTYPHIIMYYKILHLDQSKVGEFESFTGAALTVVSSAVTFKF